MPTYSEQFFKRELDVPLQNNAALFAVPEWNSFINFVDFLDNPVAIFIFDVACSALIVVNLAKVVEEGGNRDSFF